MSDFMCNLLIMGQTGTGKSSVLNYVFGTDFETGTGKPVTGQGLYEREAEIANQKIRVFDSWGLEPGKLEQWNKLIDDELRRHGADRPMEEWFHTVIYCIQSGSARVQDVDIGIIKKFLNSGYRVSVILTKADQIGDEDMATMKKTILDGVKDCLSSSSEYNGNVYDNNIEIVPTCSVSKTLRNGTVLVPYGKERIVELILENWRKTVVNKMPEHILAGINNEVDKWAAIECEIIDKSESIAGYDLRQGRALFMQEIADRAKVYFQKLENETLPLLIKEDLESCKKVDVFLNDISAPSVHINIPDYYNKVNQAWTIVADVMENISIIPLIIKCIISINKNHVTEEKKKLKDVVYKIAEDIKAGFAGEKDAIAKCIAVALGLK